MHLHTAKILSIWERGHRPAIDGSYASQGRSLPPAHTIQMAAGRIPFPWPPAVLGSACCAQARLPHSFCTQQSLVCRVRA